MRFALTHVVDLFNLGLALGQRAYLYNQDKILLEVLPKLLIPGLPYKTCEYIPHRITIRPQMGRQIKDILSFRRSSATSGTLSHRRSAKNSLAILPAAYRAWVSCYEIRERISLSQSRWCTYPVPVPVPARVFDTRRCQLQWLSPFIWIWIRKPGWTSTKALYWMCFPGWCTFILWKLQSHLLCIALLQTQRWAIPWDFQDYDQFHIPVNVGSAQELLRYVKDILSPRNSRI